MSFRSTLPRRGGARHDMVARNHTQFVAHLFACPEVSRPPIPGYPRRYYRFSIVYGLHRTRLHHSVAFAALYLLRLKSKTHPRTRRHRPHSARPRRAAPRQRPRVERLAAPGDVYLTVKIATPPPSYPPPLLPQDTLPDLDIHPAFLSPHYSPPQASQHLDSHYASPAHVSPEPESRTLPPFQPTSLTLPSPSYLQTPPAASPQHALQPPPPTPARALGPIRRLHEQPAGLYDRPPAALSPYPTPLSSPLPSGEALPEPPPTAARTPRPPARTASQHYRTDEQKKADARKSKPPEKPPDSRAARLSSTLPVTSEQFYCARVFLWAQLLLAGVPDIE
ncbi:hypothetical protein EIP86_006746 [Pleurotus ostreatoroseus]|nr:hypothetical protein EIP86_006746 [Pleurotus ostreatoroseus]